MSTTPSKMRRTLAALAVLLFPAVLMWTASRLLDRPVMNQARVDSDEVGAFVLRDARDPMLAWSAWTLLDQRFRDAYRQVETFTLTPRRRRSLLPRQRVEREIRTSLTRLCRVHDQVDIYVLSPEFADLADSLSHFDRKLLNKLRFVYEGHHGCRDEARHWEDLNDSITYVAHPRTPDSAKQDQFMFYVPFLRRLLAGWSLERAVDYANAYSRRIPGRRAYRQQAEILTGDEHLQLTRPVE